MVIKTYSIISHKIQFPNTFLVRFCDTYGKVLILNNGFLLVFRLTYTETVGHNFTLSATFDEIDHTTYGGL